MHQSEALTTIFANIGLFFCLAGLLISFCWYALQTDPTQPEKKKKLGLATWIFLFCFIQPFIGSPLLDLVSKVRPYSFDYYLFKVDEVLTGTHPSFILAHWRAQSFLFGLVTAVGYNFILGALALTGVVYILYRPTWELYRMVKLLIVNALLGLPIYLLCPAAGPKYAFPNFPNLPQHVPLTKALLPLFHGLVPPLNCVPSVHCSTAFLILVFLWRWPLGRVLGGLNALVIVLATMGSGEHYLFDVLMAVPYTLILLRTPTWYGSLKRLVTAQIPALAEARD